MSVSQRKTHVPSVANGFCVKKLLVSAASAGGNSGGPVYNEKFEVIGMLIARHPDFHHSSLCVHREALYYHIKKYFKKGLRRSPKRVRIK